ncbi:MAG: bifunctional isocitrate dehydrogenase kinase/phosphatase [Chromatiales bacterium]|jgi:isocitrate dehydrogenase kinase/phosphatase|nr:MAG: bifunctional isocitrate dehydrogenase kinase/phosphatase [Chromatiales bacterium]
MDGGSTLPMVQQLARRTAAEIFTAFEEYNQTFRAITRRADRRFVERAWQHGQRDAVERIELYDRRVEKCVADLVGRLGGHIAEVAMWREIKAEYASLIAGCPDRKFDATFFNSLTRKTFKTVGVNRDVEFTSVADEEGESHSPPRPGELPIRAAPPGTGLLGAVEILLAGAPWARHYADQTAAAQFVADEIEVILRARALSAEGLHIEALQPVFYRATRAFLVGKVAGDGWMLPLVIAFAHPDNGIMADAVMMSEHEVRPLFGFSRSYFHADLPAVEPAVQYLSSIMPGKPLDEIYTVLGRAKQGKTERYRSLFRHLARSTDSFVHAEGIRGMVMIVFTLYSSELIFKVIRDRFAEPKTVSREEVMQKYQFVFQNDRVGRLVDAQEYRQLRFPKARFSSELLEELLTSASSTCRIEGSHLIIGHCYMERRMKPLDVFLRESGPYAARRAVRDYGQAIRDLALSNVFPGDLLLKNFGVSRHGRVVFYDYDELCLITECTFRDMPTARDDEDEMRAEPWFYVGTSDVFPEQFLEFLGLRGELREEFLQHHEDLLTADYWRKLKACHLAEQHLEVVPYTRRRA